MTGFHFQKWEATGNDFVVVDLEQPGLSSESFHPELARSLCRRDSGVGADGVVLLGRQDHPPRVEIWNADGSRAEMCGNALRCVCLVLSQLGQGEGPYQIQIDRRLVEGHPRSQEQATIGMGLAVPQGNHPLYQSLSTFDELLGAQGYLISFGNPHYVVPGPGIPENWRELGAALQPLADRELGTGGINCGFVELEAADAIRQLRVYERGVGFTKSCGSGACAASATLEAMFGLAPPHRFSLPGGILEIGRRGEQFLLSGPARMEFEGRWPR